MVTRSEPDYAWDFCGGQLALDFTNTVGSRGSEPEEHFHVYGDVLSWAESSGALTRAQAQRLAAAAGGDPAQARQATQALVALRESIYRVVAAAASGKRPPPADLEVVNAQVADAWTHPKLVAKGGALTLAFEAASSPSLTLPIAVPVVRAAVDLLTTDAISRVRRCADTSCAWLFLDATRSGTRRWCDMKVCGNRSKVRRFRSRT
jgi:predicted RNA-binding Zn ribbon-like protein